MRKTLASGELVAISAPALITGFSVSKAGDLMALTVANIDGEGRATQKLLLQPLGSGIGVQLKCRAPPPSSTRPRPSTLTRHTRA